MVLAWCESSRGIAQLTRILTQLCAANRGDGGGVVVVLCQHVSCGRQGRWCGPAQCSRALLMYNWRHAAGRVDGYSVHTPRLPEVPTTCLFL